MNEFESTKENSLSELRKWYSITVLDNDWDDVPANLRLSQYWMVHLPVDSIVFGFDELELIVGLPNEFPIVLPKIYLSKKYKGKITTLPHINQSRIICTYDDERSVPNPDAPTDQILCCLYRAKKIIEAGLKGENLEDFKDEFVAYWEQTYIDEKEPYLSILSVINEQHKEGDILDLICLNKRLGKFHNILLGKCHHSDQIRKFIFDWSYEFKEYKVYFAGRLDFGYPPYNLCNQDLNKQILLQDIDIQEKFFAFLKVKQKIKIVLFDSGIEGERRLQGLRIDELPRSAKGYRIGNLPIKYAFQRSASKGKIQRVSLIPIHPRRLQKRTMGVVDEHQINNRFAIAGLGSIGSNLMYYLSSFPNSAFHIIDPDILETENISRHFLGLNYTGQYKISALQHFFQHSNPNIQIESSAKSIIELIDERSDHLNTYDVLFICIGKWNIENWIADALKTRKLSIPLCFIWVEPYLLGGHALYLHPEATKFQDFYDEDDLFNHNVISPEEYINLNPLLSLRESGCQSTYRPYSKEKVVMFLSKLFPQLRHWVSDKPEVSESFTWIGYDEGGLKGKIKLSGWVKRYKSDTTINTK